MTKLLILLAGLCLVGTARAFIWNWFVPRVRVCLRSADETRLQTGCIMCDRSSFPTIMEACVDVPYLPENVTTDQGICISRSCQQEGVSNSGNGGNNNNAFNWFGQGGFGNNFPFGNGGNNNNGNNNNGGFFGNNGFPFNGNGFPFGRKKRQANTNNNSQTNPTGSNQNNRPFNPFGFFGNPNNLGFQYNPWFVPVYYFTIVDKMLAEQATVEQPKVEQDNVEQANAEPSEEATDNMNGRQLTQRRNQRQPSI